MIGAVVAVLLAAAATAVATIGHGRGTAQTPVSFQPAALSFPDVPVNASVTRSLTMTNNSSSPVTVTQLRVTGSGEQDFSVPSQDSPGLAHRSGLAAPLAAQPPSPCTGLLRPTATCEIKLVFTPSAPGPHAADLQISLASRAQPQDVALTGTGTSVTQRPPSVSVAGIDPASGPEAGGTRVTITGTGFTSGAGVDFGTTASTLVIFGSSTEIIAASPASASAGPVDITVTTRAGTSADTTADQFTYIPATASVPTVTSIDPASGPEAGSTRVTITGTGFTSGAGVDFGTTASTLVIFGSSTEIIAASPASASAGPVDITVTTRAGTSADTTADQFTYIPATASVPTVTSIDPASGPEAGATRVTITGTGFTSGAGVDFGTTASTLVIFGSSTEIIAASPPGTGTGDVTVTTGAGPSADTTADQFTYIPATASVPTVTSIDPASGPRAGSTRVTITGTGFTSGASVDFGTTASTLVIFDSSTEIIAASPARASAGPVDITVTTRAGTSADTSADLFQYLK